MSGTTSPGATAGLHLSYELMASLIAPYGSQPALAVAKDLDAKIETLLTAAAGVMDK